MNCYFTPSRLLLSACLRLHPAEIALHGTRDLVTDIRGASTVFERATLRVDVMQEICRQLAPYQAEEKPITGQTVIYKDLSIDSLAVMDIVMELEDQFDVAIPINVVAEIRTIEELTDAILTLRARSES